MKSLYESILDTDKDITNKSKKQAEAIKNIDEYIDYIIKNFGDHINNEWMKNSDGTAFVFSGRKQCINAWERMRDDKFKGFIIAHNGPTSSYFYLKHSTLFFEWNMFKIEVSGWMGDLWLTLNTSGRQKDEELRKYALNRLKEKLS